MIVRVEPKDWMMYSVFLYFDRNAPDGEDSEAREYLAEHNLVPKREAVTTLEDREFDVLSFGGCYLGQGHMGALSEIQRNAVEKELIADKIVVLLREGPASDARKQAESMDEPQL